MSEKFQPISNTPPIGIAGKLKFYGRMLLDLQILTIYKDVKRNLPSYTGNVLDIGCGQSPYKFLLKRSETRYHGIDVIESGEFGYHNSDVISFDGKNIPFDNDTFDAVICTEVLEHVQEFQYLINEIYRTSKEDADIFVTIPWSARYHYIPYDYFRYTPSSIETMFARFSKISIKPRGTDITVIGSKMIVLFFRGFFPGEKWKYIFFPVILLGLPLLLIAVFMAHLSIITGIGSDEDPLGYTVVLKK